ncbi:tRNA (adenosine(37)-N6)-threonylcarbamoyltransferase complex dimerization subunit type 1 TsaB [Glaciecola sp. MH2013]|uniref:tRNA (adenosine(37)-N6)-threonylcarbamoyltransferase complex dimerization subunit type 1 TsaB n=1 Tax=Glaciecola sp. MH2013 TaxID=2785524 RepID=UPI00189C99B7|nr:tRNA (adenosine(37)-N6)-threonylcarbamoyltransferase complex dimerization subunit type 1 TsaB [Glaciecola sp. MH2013]MBF7072500.1 tRNA (adenosine(37)-N6)-threonylcarbamoyltransferase complex dimerization subunit type 1 TsaB [Glaciecola sp. MH2013]
MKIIAIDTATEACSVALLNGDVRDGVFELCPQQHSQRILPMIDEVLKRNDLKIGELDAIAFGRGPGSFTGVRIATGIVQGLALGTELPVLEISTLAAMAQENFERYGSLRSKVLIDARMGEVYFGDYFIKEGTALTLQEEAVLAPQESLKKYADIQNSGISNQSIDRKSTALAGTGWEAYSEQTQFDSRVDKVKVLFPNAMYMLSLAKKEFELGRAKSVDDLAPVYLRDKVTWKKLPGKD